MRALLLLGQVVQQDAPVVFPTLLPVAFTCLMPHPLGEYIAIWADQQPILGHRVNAMRFK
jgi:hypothetical protein